MPTITPPFQRRITNPLQRPLASDLNLQAFYDSVTQAYLAGAVYSASPGGNPTFATGFIGNSFRCFASTTSREVVVQKGLGFINAATAYDEDDISGIAGVNAGSYAPVVCQPDDPDAAGDEEEFFDAASTLPPVRRYSHNTLLQFQKLHTAAPIRAPRGSAARRAAERSPQLACRTGSNNVGAPPSDR